ncbi:MAG: LysR family transcriptional regulator [Alcanivorax sp.]|jgi:DNA-binding transcriptional LysR family regulator|uniref:LysR family transcriptional regulator n=1 Tax=Thalassolituus TaxID=187492 RepID=UPI00042DCD1C|nr:LysR family transcriptional regulator [Thalassolituus oleivorans]PHQ83583.1 MAG: LysR family transcriptional regulator [Thalassobium sp.]AHK15433.1 LysR family transcriptional regulator [Thalassolituus oleivorans R6-15]APR66602.1 LysR family transcriptional regulator [Thalassolituus oleivorans]MBQ0727043.1 LysR family transcriptional regulator [Thalassolituus oleivorans]MBQ0781847.1 LysR family transcriptional regulator [Thalassolituus oleivorans]
MRYTLRQLEVFLAIAHTGNLTRAANHLAMSQSAASSALKDFETQFEVQLFDRVGKRLQLNEQGRLVRPKAEALMALAQDFEQALIRHAEAGPLNVGATLSIGNYLAVGLMAEYMNDHPDAPVTLDVANTEHIAERVLNFELDIGLIEGELHHPELDVIPWREDSLAVFCDPSHPLAKLQNERPLTDDDLLTPRWILRESGSGTRQAFDRAMHGILPKLHIALQLQHTEAIKRAVEAQLGVGCLSLITLEDAFKRGNLTQLHTPTRNFRRQLYLIVHKQKYRSAGIQAWIDLCMTKTS